MSTKQTNKPLALAVGAALVGGIALSGSAFAMTDLSSGYMLSASQAGSGAEQKAAEASCGADKKTAEAKCGADKKTAEAKCGADKKTAEAKCGADKKAAEGKCGLDMMDSDKDGKVSSAEFAARHAGDTSMFAKHDTNNDGFISADELKAHMEAKCGADKKAAGGKANMEGKCGEGKCGGMA